MWRVVKDKDLSYEISLLQYRELDALLDTYNIKPQIHKAMVDGKITNEEYTSIKKEVLRQEKITLNNKVVM
jgi:hypothetical protein